jgi:hypothetical protein
MAELPPQLRQLPPWSGPAQGLTDTTLGPAERPSVFPFDSAENPDMFPPVCLRSHWDPEKISRLTLPSLHLATPLDPRPWTKICLNYVTSQGFEEAPRPNDNMVMPSGGTVYPPSRYREAIDNESLLRRLDRPLGTCEADQYRVKLSGDLFRPNSTVEPRKSSSRFIEELSFPMACIRNSDYDCRSTAHRDAWMRSKSLFNNATKQERYAVTRPDLVRTPSQPVHDQRTN